MKIITAKEAKEETNKSIDALLNDIRVQKYLAMVDAEIKLQTKRMKNVAFVDALKEDYDLQSAIINKLRMLGYDVDYHFSEGGGEDDYALVIRW